MRRLDMSSQHVFVSSILNIPLCKMAKPELERHQTPQV